MSNLLKVRSTVFSEPVFCDLFSFTNQVVVMNHQNYHDGDGCKSLTLSRRNTWGCIEPFVRIFMQIASDPMRSVKLLLI